jgi:hypothetical protein
MISLVLALAARLAQQEATPPPRRNPILDGVAVQAGESLVTFSELERAIKRVRADDPPETREDEERQRIRILRDLLTLRLEEQAGSDLGIDKEQIDRISRANLEAEREQAGLEGYLAELRARGKDALAGETDRAREIRRYLWEQTAVGRGLAFVGKRATRDHDVRPGELRAIYAENRERLAQGLVQLRVLIVSSEAAGGPEAARASCEEARRLVLQGQDLALLVEERGAGMRDTRGLTDFLPPGRMYPDMAAFATQAEIGDLSEVMPYFHPRTGEPAPEIGYQLAELHDRRSLSIPEFDSSEEQLALHKQFTEQRRTLILERAREQLRRGGYYYWVSPLIAGPKTPTANAPEPNPPATNPP